MEGRIREEEQLLDLHYAQQKRRRASHVGLAMVLKIACGGALDEVEMVPGDVWNLQGLVHDMACVAAPAETV